MRGRGWAIASVLCVVLGATLAGCTAHDVRPPSDGPVVIAVPAQAPTIQAAVDAAEEGDTVSVSPGVYEESVRISTPRITLRGLDRDGVVIDGGGLRPNGVVVTAAGVTVENLTVRDHVLNGVLVTGLSDESGGLARGSDGYTRLDPERHPPLQGFAVRYVTTSNNGLYGIYAFDAQNGVIEQSYASGHADSGIYVGQCRECAIVVRDNVAEFNAVGYEQTNASDSVAVLGNRFSRNRVGMSLMSDYQEAFVPQRRATVAGNLVIDNAEPQTPAEADGAFGIGIAVSGGQDNVLARNRVSGHPLAGIVIGSIEDVAPDGNRIEANALGGNAVDLAYTASARTPAAGNCAVGNTAAAGPLVALPEGLLDAWACPAGGARSPGGTLTAISAPPGISFRDVAAPPPQPGMPDARSGPAAAPVVDPASYPVPDPTLFADRVRG